MTKAAGWAIIKIVGRPGFQALAELGEALDKTRKRNEIAILVAGFLKRLPVEDVRAAVNLILGRTYSGKPLEAGGLSAAR